MTLKHVPVTNPANQQVLTTLPDMNQDDAERAIQAARQAFESWKNTTGKVMTIFNYGMSVRLFVLTS